MEMLLLPTWTVRRSQCGVIVFLTREPGRLWHGEFQLGHLAFWTSNTIKRVVRSYLAAEAYPLSEAVEEAHSGSGWF